MIAHKLSGSFSIKIMKSDVAIHKNDRGLIGILGCIILVLSVAGCREKMDALDYSVKPLKLLYATTNIAQISSRDLEWLTGVVSDVSGGGVWYVEVCEKAPQPNGVFKAIIYSIPGEYGERCITGVCWNVSTMGGFVKHSESRLRAGHLFAYIGTNVEACLSGNYLPELSRAPFVIDGCYDPSMIANIAGVVRAISDEEKEVIVRVHSVDDNIVEVNTSKQHGFMEPRNKYTIALDKNAPPHVVKRSREWGF